jgi:hypothetical protein
MLAVDAGQTDASFDISKVWPPPLPEYIAVELVMGPRWGQTATVFPTFPAVSGGTSPDLSQPRSGTLTGEGGSFGGALAGELRIPFIAPRLAVDWTFRGAAKAPFSFSSSPGGGGINPGSVPDVLPTRTLGFYASALGLGVGYRSLAFANGLPGLTGERSANLALSRYGLGIDLGPVEAEGSIISGFGWVADGGTAVVIPGEGEAHLGLTVWGIKAVLGVRGEGLVYGGNLTSLTQVLNPTNLTDLAEAANSAASDDKKAELARNLARASYTWGPYFEVGVSF